MKLSIIASSYNEEKHIERWYNQHKDLADEFVLVDTGSKDRTVEIAKQFNIKVIQEEWKHSYSEAKNTAIKNATGDWVFSLSPDYLIRKEDFKKIRKAIEDENYIGYFVALNYCFEKWEVRDIDYKIPKPEDYYKEGHFCLFRRGIGIEYRHRVHENAHESAFEKYPKEKIGFLPVLRFHDCTSESKFNTKDKINYFQFLEDLTALERCANCYGGDINKIKKGFLEWGDVLRKRAYD